MGGRHKLLPRRSSGWIGSFVFIAGVALSSPALAETCERCSERTQTVSCSCAFYCGSEENCRSCCGSQRRNIQNRTWWFRWLRGFTAPQIQRNYNSCRVDCGIQNYPDVSIGR